MRHRMAGGGRPERADVLRLWRGCLAGDWLFGAALGGADCGGAQAEVLIGREPGANRRHAPCACGRCSRSLWDGRFLIHCPGRLQVGQLDPQPRCPKPEKALPAFVLAGLPAVKLPRRDGPAAF